MESADNWREVQVIPLLEAASEELLIPLSWQKAAENAQKSLKTTQKEPISAKNGEKVRKGSER